MLLKTTFIDDAAAFTGRTHRKFFAPLTAQLIDKLASEVTESSFFFANEAAVGMTVSNFLAK
jgi:hypothetical protein